MFIELHIIQNFAPSCLNRDDTNTPKDCTFGDHRRARISSQCFKRAIRTSDAFRRAVSDDAIAARTRRLPDVIRHRLVEAGKDPATAIAVVRHVFEELDFKVQYEGDLLRTAVALFLSAKEQARLSEAIESEFDVLASMTEAAPDTGDNKEAASKKKKKKKKSDKPPLPESVRGALTRRSMPAEAADIALFGRMIAETTNMNVSAACQVAHAIGTHASQPEMDFFTAVDDLQPGEETGSAMMGIVEFQSACMYRYAAVDTAQLSENLGGAASLCAATVRGFVDGAIEALPSGKQTSMAAHNPPSLVLVKLKDGLPWSLTNAFQRPVRATPNAPDIVTASIAALRDYDVRLKTVYGNEALKFERAMTVHPELWEGSLTRQQLAEGLQDALAEHNVFEEAG